MSKQQERDIYIIPPNFIDTGTFFGGMFKARNVIEAGILTAVIGLPVLFRLPCSLTTRIVILCLTALPAALIALIGIDGESLTSFLWLFLKFWKNCRIVGGTDEELQAIAEKKAKHAKHTLGGKNKKEQPPAFLNPAAEYIPIERIENGIIYTKDHRYIKIAEVAPINFLLRSAAEQRGIIYSFLSYLKISPVKLQCKVLTRRADISRHIETVRQEMALEPNAQCRQMQEDYLRFVGKIGSREAVTRRFFLIFEYEPWAHRGTARKRARPSFPCKALCERQRPICGSAAMRCFCRITKMRRWWKCSTRCSAARRAPKSRFRKRCRKWPRNIWCRTGTSIISLPPNFSCPGASTSRTGATSVSTASTIPGC